MDVIAAVFCMFVYMYVWLVYLFFVVCFCCCYFLCVVDVVYLIHVTGFGKRDLIAQIMIFLYRRFSATTPKNNSLGQNFCVCLRGISHSLPTLTLSLRVQTLHLSLPVVVQFLYGIIAVTEGGDRVRLDLLT